MKSGTMKLWTSIEIAKKKDESLANFHYVSMSVCVLCGLRRLTTKLKQYTTGGWNDNLHAAPEPKSPPPWCKQDNLNPQALFLSPKFSSNVRDFNSKRGDFDAESIEAGIWRDRSYFKLNRVFIHVTNYMKIGTKKLYESLKRKKASGALSYWLVAWMQCVTRWWKSPRLS